MLKAAAIAAAAAAACAVYTSHTQQRGQRCVFCDIAADASHTRVIFRDDLVVAFDDINPASSVHILVRFHSFLSRRLRLKLFFRLFLESMFGMFLPWPTRRFVSNASA